MIDDRELLPADAAERRTLAAARLLAGGSVLAEVAAVVLAIVLLWGEAWRAAVIVGCVLAALPAIWFALTRTGAVRVVTAVVLGALIGAIVLVVATGIDTLWALVALVALGLTGSRLADAALDTVATLQPDRGRRVPSARHPVLIVNPRSGDGRAERAGLASLARARGIEVTELGPDDDLEQLTERAVADGADAVGMAGGDGSQALVAGVAARHGVAFVCVPAGTRNHLALDLGLDRDDLAGALDAFGPCHARRIDLAAVNERVFVNNVSLGAYASIVHSPEYREAKGATTAAMLPRLLGPDAHGFDLAFTDDEGVGHERPQLVQVSNNAYAVHGGGRGTRPRLDRGVLGIAAVEVQGALDVGRFVALQAAGQLDRFQGWTQWVAPRFEVHSRGPVEAGVDGEAAVLDPPLRFESRPSALTVRIPPAAPGASPAARRQRSILALLRGHVTEPTPLPGGPDG